MHLNILVRKITCSLSLSLNLSIYLSVFCPGPCIDYNCPGKSQQCVTVNGRAKCECPTCIDEGDEPACARIYIGKYAYSEQTFKNPCDARRTACLKGQDLKLVDKVACGCKYLKWKNDPCLFIFYTYWLAKTN